MWAEMAVSGEGRRSWLSKSAPLDGSDAAAVNEAAAHNDDREPTTLAQARSAQGAGMRGHGTTRHPLGSAQAPEVPIGARLPVATSSFWRRFGAQPPAPDRRFWADDGVVFVELT